MSNEREGNLGEVIDRRVQVYGDPVETFARIAQVWSGILGHEVNATDVPLCLIGMKIVRTTQAPDYSDNSDDIEGYLDIFRQLVGEDMIQARSVNEYIEKKWSAQSRPLVDRDECRHWGKHLQQSDHTEAECPVSGIAASNADQSRFYAENDRTKDAGPDEDEPIPYQLSEDERAQHLRRADTVMDASDVERCIKYGQHMSTARHTAAECPGSRPGAV